MQRMNSSRLLLGFALALCAGIAHGEVRQAAADSFFLGYSLPVHATPAKAWADLVQVQRWWSDEHTFSGKAANLQLGATAGGCFCERWLGGSVEHGRVLMALPEKVLRIDGALGPLQELALKGVLSFWIKTGDDGAVTLDVEYRVSGSAVSGLDQLAPQVDAVLGEQVARLVRYVDSGNPTAPPPEEAPGQREGDARKALLQAWAQSAAAEAAAAAKQPAPSKPGAAKPKAAKAPSKAVPPKDADSP